jgi:enoyl-[acyl-carrier protein] reductase II
MAGVLTSVLNRTYRLVKDKGGIFGINVMVSAELVDLSAILIDTAVKVVKENPAMKNHFKVIFTSAGDPVPWRDKIKNAGFTWLHVVPSVKGALRCKKGVDCIALRARRRLSYLPEPIHHDPIACRRRCPGRFEYPGRRGICTQDPAAALVLGMALKWARDSWPPRKATHPRRSSGKDPGWGTSWPAVWWDRPGG